MAASKITVRWAGPGLYLAHLGNRGAIWQKMTTYIKGAVWANEAADLHIPTTPAPTVVSEAMRLVEINQEERRLTVEAFAIVE